VIQDFSFNRVAIINSFGLLQFLPEIILLHLLDDLSTYHIRKALFLSFHLVLLFLDQDIELCHEILMFITRESSFSDIVS
jgi:hypothetical protein